MPAALLPRPACPASLPQHAWQAGGDMGRLEPAGAAGVGAVPDPGAAERHHDWLQVSNAAQSAHGCTWFASALWG